MTAALEKTQLGTWSCFVRPVSGPVKHLHYPRCALGLSTPKLNRLGYRKVVPRSVRDSLLSIEGGKCHYTVTAERTGFADALQRKASLQTALSARVSCGPSKKHLLRLAGSKLPEPGVPSE